MKSQKGMTLTSLIIYVVVMLIIVVVLTLITGYIYKGVGINDKNQSFDLNYVRFMAYMSKEVNAKNNKVISITTENQDTKNKQKVILFNTGNQITYIPENKAIYYEKIKICDNIDAEDGFTAVVDTNTEVLTITLKQENMTATNEFSFNN